MAPAMITKNQVWRCYKIKSDLNKKFLKFWLTAHLYRKWRNFLNDHNVKCLYVFICCHIRVIDQSIHVSHTCYILPLLISLRCLLYFLGSTIFKFCLTIYFSNLWCMNIYKLTNVSVNWDGNTINKTIFLVARSFQMERIPIKKLRGA